MHPALCFLDHISWGPTICGPALRPALLLQCSQVQGQGQGTQHMGHTGHCLITLYHYTIPLHYTITLYHFTVCSTLYTIYSTLYTIHSTLYTVHFTHYYLGSGYTLHIIHTTQYLNPFFKDSPKDSTPADPVADIRTKERNLQIQLKLLVV